MGDYMVPYHELLAMRFTERKVQWSFIRKANFWQLALEEIVIAVKKTKRT